MSALLEHLPSRKARLRQDDLPAFPAILPLWIRWGPLLKMDGSSCTDRWIWRRVPRSALLSSMDQTIWTRQIGPGYIKHSWLDWPK